MMVDEFATTVKKSRPVLDFVTVICHEDLPLLKLQAKSIKKFLDPNCIGRIFLIVNELAPEMVYSTLATEVLPEYQDLISHIEIIPFTRLMRPHVAVSGFRTAQTLRLLASRIVGTADYVALDSKAHFIRPAVYNSFADPRSGKARAYKQRKLPNSPQEYEAAYEYFEAPTPEFFLPVRAPFTFRTAVVRQMLEAVEAREEAHFDDFFTSATHNMSEFAMYQAWIALQPDGFDAHYRFGGRNAAGIFARAPSTPEGMEEVLANLGADATQVFSLHRKRVATLPDDAASRIVSVWVSSGLFGSEDEASAYMHSLKAGAAASLA